MGNSFRHQKHLDLPLRFGNPIPNICGPHQMLDSVISLSRISCPSTQSVRFDDWCVSHVLGNNNSMSAINTTETKQPTDLADDQLVIAVLNCNPINAYWDTQITNKACVNTLHYFLGIEIPNIILDVGIMILPLPYLWRSNVTLLSQKAGLLFVFTLGGLSVAGMPCDYVFR